MPPEDWDSIWVATHWPLALLASIEQPVRRLRGFQRVTLEPGETKSVKFRLGPSDVGFYDEMGNLVVEPGVIETFLGDSSEAPLAGTFEVTG